MDPRKQENQNKSQFSSNFTPTCHQLQSKEQTNNDYLFKLITDDPNSFHRLSERPISPQRISLKRRRHRNRKKNRQRAPDFQFIDLVQSNQQKIRKHQKIFSGTLIQNQTQQSTNARSELYSSAQNHQLQLPIRQIVQNAQPAVFFQNFMQSSPCFQTDNSNQNTGLSNPLAQNLNTCVPVQNRMPITYHQIPFGIQNQNRGLLEGPQFDQYQFQNLQFYHNLNQTINAVRNPFSKQINQIQQLPYAITGLKQQKKRKRNRKRKHKSKKRRDQEEKTLVNPENQKIEITSQPKQKIEHGKTQAPDSCSQQDQPCYVSISKSESSSGSKLNDCMPKIPGVTTKKALNSKISNCHCGSFLPFTCACATTSSSAELAQLNKTGDVRQTPTQHLYELFLNPLLLTQQKLKNQLPSPTEQNQRSVVEKDYSIKLGLFNLMKHQV